jgi:hypothetical protein
MKSKIVFKMVILALMLFVALMLLYEKKIDKYKYKLGLCEQNTQTILQEKYISIERVALLDSLDKEDLQMGKDEMLKHKVIIVGITRDNAKEFPSMVRHIENVGGFFQDYRVVLIENDSKDGTKKNLALWQLDNPRVKIVTQDFGNKKRPNHKFLAEMRNYYLEAIEAKEYEGFDMVMIIDMDMERGIDIRGIEDSFSKINQWDSVCSNGILSSSKNVMYDVFAFRNDQFPWTPSQWQEICDNKNRSDKWSEVCDKGRLNFNGDFSDLEGLWFDKDRLYWKLIMPQGKKIYPVNAPLMPVQSCFGGMAIYKRDFIQDCRYDSIDNDCEHVPFYQCMKDKNNARVMMNPSQVIRYD